MFKIFSLIFLLSPSLFAGSVSVQGECFKTVAPDKASITFNIEHLEKDVESATQKTVDKYNQLKSKIKSLKLNDAQIETSAYRVSTQNKWINGKQIFEGYRALQSLTLETSDLSKVGKSIEVANRLKVKNIGQLTHTISTKLRRKTESECLKEASLDAQKKARTLAKSLGAKLGKVQKISEYEQAVSGPQPRMMMESLGMNKVRGGGATSPSIDVGKRDIQKYINVTFELI